VLVSLGVARWLRGMLLGVGAYDPAAFLAAPALLGLVALVAVPAAGMAGCAGGSGGGTP
jgi:hypothetical protein